MGFLPVCREDMKSRNWDCADFVIVTGDAYVDHSSFGTAVISRVLEHEGYRVAVLAQPNWVNCEDFKEFGRPRLGFLVNSGNVDSMVAHYSVNKHRRATDWYSPAGKAGLRPDRAVTVYCNRIREAYSDMPIIIGGIEASTRRLAHYDYWSDKVRRSILVDSGADLLSYGMGEKSIKRIAYLLDRGVPVKNIRDVRGTCFFSKDKDCRIFYDYERTGSFEELRSDKEKYAKAFLTAYRNTDAISGKAIVEEYEHGLLVQNPPMPPLTTKELDEVYELPYMRDFHPKYIPVGGVPAVDEVKFSVTHNRGCMGACNFCALAYHQGRTVSARSIDSVVREVKLITKLDGFKGYINDVGGPTANFRQTACEKQKTLGVCRDRKCLFPKPCPNLIADHSDYVKLLKKVKAVDGVKRVFIRSGIRFDYLLCDKNNEEFFDMLVRDHVSGQLRVAPEHCSSNVLAHMGKPDFKVYEKFVEKFYKKTKEAGKEQYVVPYLMSSHPGSTLDDAAQLAIYLKKNRLNPEQVQDFYPTPGTASTCMFYTGIDPFTGKSVYVATDPHEKRMQRALLQFSKPENYNLVKEALIKTGREDLIGYGPDCLIAPRRTTGRRSAERDNKKGAKPERNYKAGGGTARRNNKKPIKH